MLNDVPPGIFEFFWIFRLKNPFFLGDFNFHLSFRGAFIFLQKMAPPSGNLKIFRVFVSVYVCVWEGAGS